MHRLISYGISARSSDFGSALSDNDDSDGEVDGPQLVNNPVFQPDPPSPICPPAPQKPLRSSTRSNKGIPPDRLGFGLSALTDQLVEPQTLDEALNGPQSTQWRAAMAEELQSLLSSNTWDLVSLPVGAKAVPVKWVFKIKRDQNGSVTRFKARLVVQGFRQQQGVDFDEVFAPTSKHTTLRLLLAIAAANDLEIQQLDIKTAFLNGFLEEQVYVKQPPGFPLGSPDLVCHLNKALYGLRQAPRAWFTRLKQELVGMGFTPSESDPALFTYHSKDAVFYLLVWVDDFLYAYPPSSSSLALSLLDQLKEIFDVQVIGNVSYFLGMEVIRDRTEHTIKLCQRQYIIDLVLQYGQQDAKPRPVPMDPSFKPTADGILLDVSQFQYSSLVGSLLYAAVCTRPDIAYAVGVLCRFMAAPTTQHWDAAIWLLRYLHGTSQHGLVYGQQSFLQGYCDADYAGDLNSRKSTTGLIFVFNKAPISWSSRLQPTVALSTAEAEYMAAADAVKEALWLRKLLMDFNQPIGPVPIYGDNQGALKLLKHPIASARSKHIDTRHHFARERVAFGEVKFAYISTDYMLADILTKALPKTRIEILRQGLGISD